MLKNYLQQLQRELRTGKTSEHTFRPALKSLIESLRSGVDAVNEPGRVACGAPDFRVLDRKQLLIGYIETKDLDVALTAIEKTDQIKRYRASLENLLLTNYLDFRWFVRGELRKHAKIGSLNDDDRIIKDRAGFPDVESILEDFLSFAPEPVGRANELAERMARHTRGIRDILQNVFQQKKASPQLQQLFNTLKGLLIPHLGESQFSDMFAQSLAYGLFAARCSHVGNKFRLADAAREIPATNPFLRELFYFITGTRFDDEPFAGFVHDLVQLLGNVDMPSVLADFGVRSRNEDPVLHFYETFLSKYDPTERERRGVYYTPESVISYIVRSVDQLLKDRFGCPKGLADSSRIGSGDDASHKVLILDPACGTGSFLYGVVNHIRDRFMESRNAGQWEGYVSDHLIPRLFGFELLMAPYAVAHLKLGMQLEARDMTEAQRRNWACDLSNIQRLNVFLTDTLEPTHAISQTTVLGGDFIAEEVNAASDVKSKLPIMVVLGNPPYSGHSASKSDWIKKLINHYKFVDGLPLGEKNSKWLQDDYVKFIRFGQWRIEQTGAGILAFITNHAYLDNPTFRGMRQQLMKTFDEIYILNLHGNAKKKEKALDGSKDDNVFDIQQGVAIGIFVKKPDVIASEAKQSLPPQRSRGGVRVGQVQYADLWGSRSGKDEWLHGNDLDSTDWQTLSPSSPFYLFIPQDTSLRNEYYSYPSITDIFRKHSVGIVTARDSLTIEFTKEELMERVSEFLRLKPEAARERFILRKDSSDWNVEWAQEDLKRLKPSWEAHITPILYRPFDIRWTVYTGRASGFHVRPRPEVMKQMLGGNNLCLITVRQVAESIFNHVLVSNYISDFRTSLSNKGGSFVFPYKITTSGGETLNLRDGRRFELPKRFQYVYAVLNSEQYRTRYLDYLRIDFPHIPFTKDKELFRCLAQFGSQLIDTHLLKSPLLIETGVSYPVPGSHLVEKGFPKFHPPNYSPPADAGWEEAERVYINKDQYFDGIPPEVWNFQIGGYQVLDKWLKERRGRILSGDDIEHFSKVVKALVETIRIMGEIDAAIPCWPLS